MSMGVLSFSVERGVKGAQPLEIYSIMIYLATGLQ